MSKKSKISQRTARSMEYAMHSPKSRCTCGHTGDGANSEHGPTFQVGHGECLMCKCDKFTWGSFLPEYDKAMNITPYRQILG